MKRISKAFNPINKRSVANLHRVLRFLTDGFVDESEERARTVGERTRSSILQIAPEARISERGELPPEVIDHLNEALTDKKYRDADHVAELHKRFETLRRKKFVDLKVAEAEVENKNVGPTTRKFIKAFQEKYKLHATGKIDAATDEKLESVITSIAGSKPKPRKMLKTRKPSELTRNVHYLRLNMKSEKVQKLQKNLAWLGYKIHAEEYDKQVFGKTTREAVKNFQRDHVVPITGRVDSGTAKALNKELAKTNPQFIRCDRCRVRGSVRDAQWRGKAGVTVQVFRKGLRGNDELLGERKTFKSGFYDILYSPPLDPVTRAPREPLHIVVRMLDAAGNVVAERNSYRVKKVHWVNFTEGDDPYRGVSDFEARVNALSGPLESAGLSIEDIEESDASQDVVFLSRETGMLPEQVMRVSLAFRIADEIGVAALPPAVFYGFLRQNLPPETPTDLFPDSPDEWADWIPRMVDVLTTGIVFLDDEIQEEAIDTAFERNVIPHILKPQRDNILTQLSNVREQFVLTKPMLVGDGDLQSLLDLSAVPTADRSTVARTFIQHQGMGGDFWDELEAENIDTATLKSFRTVVDLGSITKNHSGTMQVLMAKMDDAAEPRFNRASDFAKLTQDEWGSLIRAGGGGIPGNIDGQDENERLLTYAATLRSRSEQRYPGVALVADVGRSTEHGLTHVSEVAQFIDSVEDFDLGRDNLEKSNLDNQEVLSAAALAEGKVIQRVHRIAQNAELGTALLNEKLHSSMQIYFTGQDRLVAQLEARGLQRRSIFGLYRRAEHQYAHALSTLMRMRFDLLRDSPTVVPDFTYTAAEVNQFKKDIPNIEVLFGSVDYCDCEHCSSMYSPAAYLADMLRFLEEKKAVAPGDSVQDVLLDRRPDLANIKLSCANTDTPLPYIDLVNEVLENAIPPATASFSHQTTLSAEELLATPEHLRPHAYEVLKDAAFPMSVSFNLWQEDTRLFLDHLGVPRQEIMEDFQNRSDTTNKLPPDIDIAAEYFGISSQEQAIIVPAASEANAAKQDEYWGFDTTQTSAPVAAILQSAKLEYDELLALLQVEFVNPASDRSVINRPVDDCDVDKQMVDSLSLAKFDRMHRFLRLWRRNGWAMWELDLLIRNAVIGNGNLNADCLVQLRQFKLLQDDLGVTAEKLLSFYGPVNTEIRVASDATQKEILPLYHSLFLNIAVTNPVDTHFELPMVAEPITDHLTTVLSALAITDSDLSLIAAATDGQTTVQTLSALYRHSLLAKRIGVSITDLLKLFAITDVADPFADPETTRRLLEDYRGIQAAGFTIVALDYVLNFVPDSSAGVREEVILQYMEVLRSVLRTLQDDLLGSDDGPREVLEKHLTRIPEFDDADTLSRALDLIEGTWADSEASRLAFINEHFSVFIPASANPGTSLTTLNLFDGDQLTTTEEDTIRSRYDYVIGHLYPYLNANLITEHIASYFGLSNQHAELLLDRLHVTGSGLNLREHLQNEDLTEQDADGNFVNTLDCATLPFICNSYNLMHKISLILDRFELSVNELEWFIDHHGDIGSLDLEALPIMAPPPASLFTSWWRWWRTIEFKQQFPEPEDVTLYDVLESGTNPAAVVATLHAQLATLTQIEAIYFTDLHTGLGLNVAALDYARPETYHRLWTCIKHARRAGVSIATMFDWSDRSNPADDAVIAAATRQAAKSKYEVGEWLGKVRPIEDELRERKRNALVAYLIEHSLRNEPETIASGGDQIPNPRYLEDINDLFGYFLIDVVMSACQLTSRIKQAISSVQLFVQRCFLNLEARFVKVPNQDPDLENSWKQWKWMQNYRIWEANRKVFFYPENWIEPELRDDKTPFFKELEDEILQSEITKDNVEQAYVKYLNKVDEVSHLEVVGIYHDFHGPKEEIHVVGRTRSEPHKYFHRTYDLDYFVWTPWEQIDLDITGSHAIPVVYNRKLHLFWLKFESKPLKLKKNAPAQASSTSTDNPEPARLLEIQLAWSVKTRTGWSPKSLSANKLIHPWERPEFAYHIKPRYKASDNTLWVDLFVSTTEEFNSTRFYDQFESRLVYKTKIHPFNETYRPWHSSSFVFDGNVRSLKLRGLMAHYAVPVESVAEDTVRYEKRYISSYEYVHANFEQQGRAIEELKSGERAGRLIQPSRMHHEFNRLTNNTRHLATSSLLSIIGSGLGSNTILTSANGPFQAVLPMQTPSNRPFVYQDAARAFFLKSEFKSVMADYQTRVTIQRFVAYPFYHPYTRLFIQELNRSGIDGLLNRRIQRFPQNYQPPNNFNFNSEYRPKAPHEPDQTARKDIVDFSFGGAFSVYNWELFFHVPMMIAGKLSQNQQFEEATRWYHYVFNPTNTENLPVPRRYWITKPFFEHSSADYRQQRIQNIIDKIDDFADQVTAWKNDPFKPHLIARYRPVAYQRNVVMKYIDNLIAWGDQLYRRDTLESINQASLLYILAYELLGDRPKEVPAIPRNDKTYQELLAEGPLDIFGNNMIEVAAESELGLPIRIVPSTEGAEPLPRLETLYFCIPRNDQLMGYWDTVEDRLTKIRNCMNIEGVVRQLPLFAPPIDPALLVKAAAAGIDLGSVLDDLSVPNPNYRFRTLVQMAARFCSEVKNLGANLLRALEQKDAEGLATLRSMQEIQLQNSIKEIRKRDIDESDENIAALEASLNVVEERRLYYEGIPKKTDGESAAMVLNYLTIRPDTIALGLNIAAGAVNLIPDVQAGGSGVGGSPHVTAKFGGRNVAGALANFAAASQGASQIMRTIAGELEKQAQYTRQYDNHQFQMRLAEKEKLQIEKQQLAADIRKDIAEKELATQELRIENTKTEDEYLRNKYTNEQLYNWMLTQVSSIYFQAYQLAYDMAKRAEKSFRQELALGDSNYIQFGYWDSLKKGLLAGDKLMNDISRMEVAYFDQHKRELELTKHVSLAQVSPLHLMQLKLTGQCTLELPEWLFDMDYPGHYMRRIKSVALSVPCVTGPYSGIHCTLSLQNSRVRINTLVGSSYDAVDTSDTRFRHLYGAIQSIATSHAQEDTGLFELNFNDERFLPFEGLGVMGTWLIKMPQESNQFDFSTISDVIIHVRYTARDGGANLAMAAQSHLNSILPTSGVLLLSARHQFPNEWHRFLHPAVDGSDQELLLDVRTEHYPFYAKSATNLKVSKIDFVIEGQSSGDYHVEMALPGQPAENFDVSKDANFNDVHHKEHATPSLPNGKGQWSVKVRRASDGDFQSLPTDNIDDLFMIVSFQTS
ncbi:MAG: neuraminidase-like domain-containing protein [Candidatus Thiodiazotropha sp.]